MAKLISIGEIIDSSWELYRERFLTYLNIAGWLILVMIFQVVALLFYPSTTTLATGASLSGWENFGVLLYGFSSLILAPILGLWIFIALSKAAYLQIKRRSVDTKKLLKESWKWFFPSVLVTILVGLIIVGGILLGVVPPILIGVLAAWFDSAALLTASNILLVIGIFVALILTLRWSVHYVFAPYEVALEDTRGRKALTASHKITEGRFWSVLLRIMLPKLLFLIVGALIMWICSYLAAMVINTVAGLNTDLLARLSTYVDTIIPALIAILLNPLLVLADVILFKNLRDSR
jgi:hypothetical protein